MSNFLTKLFSGGVGELVKGVGDVADRFIQTKDEKAQFEIALEGVITERLSQIEESVRTRLNATMEIIRAEMQSGDNYTRRARPTVVYFGLLLIGFNYALRPLLWPHLAPVEFPEEFWWGWSSVVGIWSLGRSAERIGLKGKVTTMATGKTKLDGLLD